MRMRIFISQKLGLQSEFVSILRAKKKNLLNSHCISSPFNSLNRNIWEKHNISLRNITTTVQQKKQSTSIIIQKRTSLSCITQRYPIQEYSAKSATRPCTKGTPTYSAPISSNILRETCEHKVSCISCLHHPLLSSHNISHNHPKKSLLIVILNLLYLC